MSRQPYREPQAPDEHAVVVVEPSRGALVGWLVPVAWLLAAALALEVRSVVGLVLAVLVIGVGQVAGHRPGRRWLVAEPDAVALFASRAFWWARRLGGCPTEGGLEVSVRADQDPAGSVAEVHVVGAEGWLTIRVDGEVRASEIAEALREALTRCGVVLQSGAALKGRITERSSRDGVRLSWRSRPHSFAREEVRRALASAASVAGLVVGSVLLLRSVGVVGGVLVLGWGAYNLGALRRLLRDSSGATRLAVGRGRWKVERSRFGWVRAVSGQQPVSARHDPAGGVILEAGGRTIQVGAELTDAEARWVADRVAAAVRDP